MKPLFNLRTTLFLPFLLVFNYLCAQPKYEFRGAWIATVANIDWPSPGNYNSESQKAEYIRLLDMHQRNGLNAVVVQVRPATDAFYPSPYEPWSEWLTGKQGKPPSPYYDPLKFMIEEAHKRGMEFHAWCNPYRAEFQLGKSSIARNHITRLHPEWFLKYGGKRYFDPGNKAAQQFVVKVIRDIVKRYDVDAIHFDDYFYPYRVAGQEFPDADSYKKYGDGLDKDDWRRSNVDSVIVMLARAIKEVKPLCRFGISPFGVWRNIKDDPDGSDTRAGVTNYDDLYADILLWLKNGWIDYVAPQLYWEFGHKNAAFEVLLEWWSRHTYGKHCYIGLGIYRAGSSEAWRDSTLLPRQLQAIRSYPQLQGAIYFSSKSFVKNPNGWSDSLRQHYYNYPALIPPMDHLSINKPSPPSVDLDKTHKSFRGDSISLYIDPAAEDQQVKHYAVYAFREPPMENYPFSDPSTLVCILPASSFKNKPVKLPVGNETNYMKVTAINTVNEESEAVDVDISKTPSVLTIPALLLHWVNPVYL